jgi:hypothetical protein
MQIKLKTSVKWWRFCMKVEIISPPPNKYSTSRLRIHTQTAKVEVVEMVEIFSILDGWVVTTSSYNQLAIVLQF